MFRSIIQIYTKGSDEAFKFYKKAFDAKIGFQDVDENGTVIHRELDVCGQAIAVGEANDTNQSGGNRRITGNTMQFCLQFGEGQEEKVRKAYEILAESSEIITPFGELFFSPCGVELIDKYGVWWCLFV
ncbi:VOC family protein [Clostridium sp. C2-6-12]|uniref:VOC family protein n=1 Tax=Clostridium sp. C2-6-12 TaxID=2698832 RepID=UPI00136E3619|nr:VOC family protein [Clostridium sp. C2-6-12]